MMKSAKKRFRNLTSDARRVSKELKRLSKKVQVSLNSELSGQMEQITTKKKEIEEGITATLYESPKQNTRYKPVHFTRQARLKIKRKGPSSLSANPIKYVLLQQSFPGKPYSSNFHSCELLRSLYMRSRHYFALNSTIPYLGEKISLILIGQMRNPSIVPNT